MSEMKTTDSQFLYALECKSVPGTNVNLKGAISIKVLDNEPPPDISDVSTNHAGTSSGSSQASGNFCPHFIIDDEGEHEAAVKLTELAINNKNRTAEEFVLTRYTVHGNEVIMDTKVTFHSHYIKIPEGGMDKSAHKRHTYSVQSSDGRSKVTHMSFKKGSGATKFATAQNIETILMVNKTGDAVIQPS